MRVRVLLFTILLTTSFALSPYRSSADQPPPPKVEPQPKADAPANPLPIEAPFTPKGYKTLFLKVIEAVAEDYEISSTNRYDGRVEAEIYLTRMENQPAIHLCVTVVIKPSDVQKEVYWIEVSVRKEREELVRGADSKPRLPLTPEEQRWAPVGRDGAAEAVILRRLAEWAKDRK
jgi:hypothetical protein